MKKGQIKIKNENKNYIRQIQKIKKENKEVFYTPRLHFFHQKIKNSSREICAVIFFRFNVFRVPKKEFQNE